MRRKGRPQRHEVGLARRPPWRKRGGGAAQRADNHDSRGSDCGADVTHGALKQRGEGIYRDGCRLRTSETTIDAVYNERAAIHTVHISSAHTSPGNASTHSQIKHGCCGSGLTRRHAARIELEAP
jgi:hypothetical protein